MSIDMVRYKLITKYDVSSEQMKNKLYFINKQNISFSAQTCQSLQMCNLHYDWLALIFNKDKPQIYQMQE